MRQFSKDRLCAAGDRRKRASDHATLSEVVRRALTLEEFPKTESVRCLQCRIYRALLVAVKKSLARRRENRHSVAQARALEKAAARLDNRVGVAVPVNRRRYV